MNCGQADFALKEVIVTLLIDTLGAPDDKIYQTTRLINSWKYSLTYQAFCSTKAPSITFLSVPSLRAHRYTWTFMSLRSVHGLRRQMLLHLGEFQTDPHPNFSWNTVRFSKTILFCWEKPLSNKRNLEINDKTRYKLVSKRNNVVQYSVRNQ